MSDIHFALTSEAESTGSSWTALFQNPGIGAWSRIVVAMAANAGQQLMGSNVISSFGPYIFQTSIGMSRHEAQPRLLIIGAALLAGSYDSHDNSPPGCMCWRSVPRGCDGHAVIRLRLELPDEVALGSVIARPDKFDSHDRGRIVSYINHYAIGTAMAHSGAGSPLTSHTKGKHTLRGPPRRPCADCRKTGNPFWYVLSPDEAGIVSFGP